MGTSGWQYADWRGRLYPGGVAQREWLTYYSDRFQSVEVNNVFYRLPEKATVGLPRRPRTLSSASRRVATSTHVPRLSKPAEPVRRLLGRSSGLGHKVGPILLQLPANFRGDPARLASTLEAFPPCVRVAFEPRHESWYTDEVADIYSSTERRCVLVTPHSGSPRSGAQQIGHMRGCMRADRIRLHTTAGRPSPIGPGVSLTFGTPARMCTSILIMTTAAVPSATPTALRSLPSMRDFSRRECRRVEKHR